jgi:RNase H-like domain found in reverse transcriptase/Integrase core domain/Integrase zinc binding domain
VLSGGVGSPKPGDGYQFDGGCTDSHVGVVLQQKEVGQWKALSFYSKKLDAAQRKYSAFDRELLATYLPVWHFRYSLEGRAFMLFTDQKPLTFALRQASDPWTARQQRQLAFLAEFTSDIWHITSGKNVAMDALSRPAEQEQETGAGLAWAEMSPGLHSFIRPGQQPPATALSQAAAAAAVDVGELAAAQHSCPQCQQLIASAYLRVQQCKVDNVSLWCDFRTGQARPLVPPTFRQQIFQALHWIVHPGIRGSWRLISGRFLWEKIADDIGQWCRDCVQCNKGKVVQQPAAPVQPIKLPPQLFVHIHVDLVGPLPCSAASNTHLFTVIDRSTRWMEAILLSSTTAAACAAMLFSGWVARYRVPDVITSDRGVQFVSEVWQHICSRLNIKHKLTTAYHPQANGMLERFHRQLKASLRSREANTDWESHLPWVMLGLRAAPKEDSGLSVAELTFAVTLKLPGELVGALAAATEVLAAELRSDCSSFMPLPLRARWYAEVAGKQLVGLQAAKLVYICRSGVHPALAAKYDGHYGVLEKQDKYFVLQVGDLAEKVMVDRLKPHLGTDPVPPAAPPKHGRLLLKPPL